MEFRQNFARQRFAALGLIASWPRRIPSLSKKLACSDLRPSGFEYASLRIYFQKHIYILDEKTAQTRLHIVQRDDIFVQLENLDDLITFLHGQPIEDPGTVRAFSATEL